MEILIENIYKYDKQNQYQNMKSIKLYVVDWYYKQIGVDDIFSLLTEDNFCGTKFSGLHWSNWQTSPMSLLYPAWNDIKIYWIHVIITLRNFCFWCIISIK